MVGGCFVRVWDVVYVGRRVGRVYRFESEMKGCVWWCVVWCVVCVWMVDVGGNVDWVVVFCRMCVCVVVM